jgi:hypothetical protein
MIDIVLPAPRNSLFQDKLEKANYSQKVLREDKKKLFEKIESDSLTR